MLQVFEQAAEGRDALLALVGGASGYIQMDATLLRNSSFGAELLGHLLERCAKGLRLLLFAPPLPTALLKVKLALLRNEGATVKTLSPPRGTLQRQLLVADGLRAWWGPDLPAADTLERGPHLYIEGPVVLQLQQMFVQTRPPSGLGRRTANIDDVLSEGSAHDLQLVTDSGRDSLLVGAIEAARRRVVIGLAQRPPAREVMDVLSSASKRGVKVSVLLQHGQEQEWRWHQCCNALLHAGAWVYHGGGPLVFAPHCTVDDAWSCLTQGGGDSTNASSLVVQGEAFAEALDAACQDSLERATLLDARKLPDDRLVHQFMRVASELSSLLGVRAG